MNFEDGTRTVCGVHYIVEVVYCKTAVVASLAGNTAKSVLAFAPWFVSTFSRKKTP